MGSSQQTMLLPICCEVRLDSWYSGPKLYLPCGSCGCLHVVQGVRILEWVLAASAGTRLTCDCSIARDCSIGRPIDEGLTTAAVQALVTAPHRQSIQDLRSPCPDTLAINSKQSCVHHTKTSIKTLHFHPSPLLQ